MSDATELIDIIVAKINPAKSEYEPVQRLKRQTDQKSIVQSLGDGWALEDPADTNDYLLRVDEKGYDAGRYFRTRDDAEKALEAFKNKKLFGTHTVIPVDVWFAARSKTQSTLEGRKLSESEERSQSLQWARKQMGWSDYAYDPSMVPTDREVDDEVKTVLKYIPACVLRDIKREAIRIASVDNPTAGVRLLRQAESELSMYLGADLLRLQPKSRPAFSRIATQCLDMEQESALLGILASALGMSRVSNFFTDFRTVVVEFKRALRVATFLTGHGVGVVVPNVSYIYAAFDSLESSVLDSLRRASGAAFSTSLKSGGKLRLSHLVLAVDLTPEFQPQPSGDEEKLLNLALELGMDAKYNSRDELIRDLTYVLRGMGLKVDLSSSTDKKLVSRYIGTLCKDADGLVLAEVVRHLSEHKQTLGNLADSGFKLADLTPVLDAILDERAEVEKVIMDLGVDNKAKATNLLIQWDVDRLTFMDRQTRNIFCQALISLCQKYGVKPKESWSLMLEHPEIYDTKRDSELVGPELSGDVPAVKLIQDVAI
jgi:hypothetical protein